MNIILARTFLELVRTRNFNRAAERLCVTQSTVTVRIAALEEQLGQQLFTRDKSGADLTVAGRKFQPYAELLLQTWQHAQQELALSAGQSAMFSLGLCSELWEEVAEPWLIDLQRTQPNLALNIESGSSATILEKLSQGFLDAGLLCEPSPRRDIIISEFLEERFVLVSTYPRRAERWNPHYVYIRWGDDFIAQHRAIMPVDITPPVTFVDGKAALDFVLKRGGSAYFPYRQVASLITDGRLFIVENASAMLRHAFIAYTKAVGQNEWFQEALASLRTQAVALAARTPILNGKQDMPL